MNALKEHEWWSVLGYWSVEETGSGLVRAECYWLLEEFDRINCLLNYHPLSL